MKPFSKASVGLQGSVYSRFAARLAEHEGPVYPLHIGDTWMEPAVGARMQDLTVDSHPGLHRYTPVRGHPQVVEALCAEVTANQGIPCAAEELLVTAGATGGLAALVGAIVHPGCNVVILAPHWPLVAGMVRSFGGEARVVPFIGTATDAGSAAAILEQAIDPNTVAVYWNTPNNPTGVCIPRDWLLAMVEVARHHDLFILADEVYEHFVYGRSHTYSRPLAPERTVAVHSFSKAYGMAGNRVGYLVGPAAVIEHTQRITTHTYYSAPTAGQLAAAQALTSRAWLDAARASYASIGRWAAQRLGLPEPEGSTFLFPFVGEAAVEPLLERAVARGLLVAPGSTFGPYAGHVRICFTSAPPEQVQEGVEILASLMG